MLEIATFVFNAISSCFNAMRHFSLQSGGFPTFFDFVITLFILKCILYVKQFIQNTTEIESNDLVESNSYVLSHSSPYVKLHKQKYNVPNDRR